MADNMFIVNNGNWTPDLALTVIGYYLPHKINVGIARKDGLYVLTPDRLADYIKNRFVDKPVLRPKTDLTNRAQDGRRCIDIINANSTYHISFDERSSEIIFDDLPEKMPLSWVIESYHQLFKYHFDVFGLIKAGLAIDINTIPDL